MGLSMINGRIMNDYHIPADIVKSVWSKNNTFILAADIAPQELRTLDSKSIRSLFINPMKTILQDALKENKNFYTNYMKYIPENEIQRFLVKCFILDNLQKKQFDNPIFLYHRTDCKYLYTANGSFVFPGGNRIDTANLLQWPTISCFLTVNEKDYESVPWKLINIKKYSYEEFFNLYPNIRFLIFDDNLVPCLPVNQKEFHDIGLQEYTQQLWKKIKKLQWYINSQEFSFLLRRGNINTVTYMPKIVDHDVRSLREFVLRSLSVLIDNDAILGSYKKFTYYKNDYQKEAWSPFLKKFFIDCDTK